MVVAGPHPEGMVALQGLLDPEAAVASGALMVELARRTFEAGQLPQSGGVRPQLSVIVDLDSLLGHPGAVGGDAGWAGPSAPRRVGGWPATGR